MKTEALLTPHMVAALRPKAKEYTLHDAGCPGLALRVQPSGARSWVAWTRQGGRTRRITLGPVTELTLDQARAALHRQRAVPGAMPPPARGGLSFGALCARFLAAREGVYRPRTLACLRAYLDSQLLPAFGGRKVARIGTPDLAAWFHGYARTRPGGANQALLHFTTILNWGKAAGHIPHDLPNPAAPIRRNRRPPRGRMLNGADLARLAAVLAAAPARSRDAAEAIELILLTGCRSGEILRLSWAEVKADRLELERTKTGPRIVFLNRQAMALLDRRRPSARAAFVFPSPVDSGRPRASVTAVWQQLRDQAGLPATLRLHDLRHTYASHALLAGESLPVTGRLLGHRNPASTDRYAHLDPGVLTRAADAIAEAIERMMHGG
jgi:integrase